MNFGKVIIFELANERIAGKADTGNIKKVMMELTNRTQRIGANTDAGNINIIPKIYPTKDGYNVILDKEVIHVIIPNNF